MRQTNSNTLTVVRLLLFIKAQTVKCAHRQPLKTYCVLFIKEMSKSILHFGKERPSCTPDNPPAES